MRHTHYHMGTVSVHTVASLTPLTQKQTNKQTQSKRSSTRATLPPYDLEYTVFGMQLHLLQHAEGWKSQCTQCKTWL